MAVLTSYASSYTNVVGTVWANQLLATGSTTGNYCTWTNSTRNSNGAIDFNGYGTWSDIPAGSTINSVTVTIKGYVNSTTFINGLTTRLYIGATAKGTAATTLTRTTTSTNIYSSIVYTDVSLAELQGNTMLVNIAVTHNNSTSQGINYLDYFQIDVDYTALSASFIKVYNGSTWNLKPIKVYTGGSWQYKPVKRWTGSSWVLI